MLANELHHAFTEGRGSVTKGQRSGPLVFAASGDFIAGGVYSIGYSPARTRMLRTHFTKSSCKARRSGVKTGSQPRTSGCPRRASVVGSAY